MKNKSYTVLGIELGRNPSDASQWEKSVGDLSDHKRPAVHISLNVSRAIHTRWSVSIAFYAAGSREPVIELWDEAKTANAAIRRVEKQYSGFLAAMRLLDQ